MDETTYSAVAVAVVTNTMYQALQEAILQNPAYIDAMTRVLKKQLWRWKMRRTPMAKHHAETALIQYRTMTGTDL